MCDELSIQIENLKVQAELIDDIRDKISDPNIDEARRFYVLMELDLLIGRYIQTSDRILTLKMEEYEKKPLWKRIFKK